MFSHFFKLLKSNLGKLLSLFLWLGLVLLVRSPMALAAPACEVPRSGDWIVRSSCDLVRSATAPQNVSVANGATLRVTNGNVLTVDFPRFNLRVGSNSRVLITPLGKIRSIQRSFPGGNNSGGSGGSGGSGASGGSGGSAQLPETPRWIQFSGNPTLIIDFGLIIDGQPRITLPVDPSLKFLPDYLPYQNNNLIVPDNFCGFNVRNAASFSWQTQDNQVVTSFPYNAVESVESLGSNEFLGGIRFTGPIGQCAGTDEPWQFFQPLTRTGMNSPIPGLKLVIQLSQGSKIDFLNFNIRHDAPMSADELFSDDVFDAMKTIKESFSVNAKDNGYCGIDAYLRKICEENPNGRKCIIGDDFVSPC